MKILPNVSSLKNTDNADVDFVIIWVDGNDTRWQKQKTKYSQLENSKTKIDDDPSRYRDWDNLRYWFRGVEEFTPWVRKIHFVTAGHVPAWLNLDNPKLNVVKHEDYIPRSYLPTFSSHPIELNLHRIEGLAEQFVFFNDDMFITKLMDKTDFFVNGLPCDQAQLSRTVSQDNDDIFPHIILNNVGMLNKHFDKNHVVARNICKWLSPKYGIIPNLRNLLLLPYSFFPGFSWNHLPSSFLKSTYDEVWANDFETMDRVSSNRFRSIEDVNQYVIRGWQLASGTFYPKNMFKKYGKSYTNLTDQKGDACVDIIRQHYSMVCINDIGIDDNFEQIRDEINTSFSTLLPNISSFENQVNL